MPKMKTHSGAKKRFSKTGSGKIKYQKSGRRHQLSCKDAQHLRRLREPGIVSDALADRFKELLPYA